MSPFNLEGMQPDVCLGLPTSVLMLAVLGDLLWVVAYALIVWQAFRNRTYGVPIAAIAMNFTWEVLYTLFFPTPCGILELLRVFWLVLDCLIVLQLLVYGKKEQRIPHSQQYFFAGVSAIFLFCLIGHLTFRTAFVDPGGVTGAFAINLIMSILFVGLFFSRRRGHGLSYGGAWAKMLGTVSLSIANAILFHLTSDQKSKFMIFLFVMILIFDALYVGLLRQVRVSSPEPQPTAV